MYYSIALLISVVLYAIHRSYSLDRTIDRLQEDTGHCPYNCGPTHHDAHCPMVMSVQVKR